MGTSCRLAISPAIMTIVDRADGSAGIDAVIQGQGQRGQTVNLRYETRIDYDGWDAAVAVESGAGDPEVDVGRENDPDNGVAGIGGDAGDQVAGGERGAGWGPPGT